MAATPLPSGTRWAAGWQTCSRNIGRRRETRARGGCGGDRSPSAPGGASAAAEAHADTGSVRVGELAALTPDRPLWFGYPDGRSPAVALKVGASVPGGVGPERDVVAFSAVCTHLGCVVEVRDRRTVCPCHLSMFDPRVGGRCYQGPAPTRLARIRLRLDDGVLYAIGAEGEVWGR